MHFHHTPWGGLVLWAAAIPALSLPAAAQTPPSELSYPAALQNYQRYAPVPVASWPQANQAVHERGGWRAYAREAAASVAPHHPTPPHR